MFISHWEFVFTWYPVCSGQSASPSLPLPGMESTLESDPLQESASECTLTGDFGDNFFPNIRALCLCGCACVLVCVSAVGVGVVITGLLKRSHPDTQLPHPSSCAPAMKGWREGLRPTETWHSDCSLGIGSDHYWNP